MVASANPLKQSLWQIPSIIALSCLIALGVNYFRSDSIPLIGAWSVDARFSDSAGDSMVISLEQARKLFEQKFVLFLDARPKEQYDEGHIEGALSLPQQEAENYFVQLASELDNTVDKTIITYCDGETCELSHELALFLKEMGFDNVRILVNGWSVWNEAGLPKEISE